MLSLTWAPLKIGFQHPAISQCWNHDVEKNVPFWPLSSSADHQRVPHSVLCIEARAWSFRTTEKWTWIHMEHQELAGGRGGGEGVVLCGSGGVLRMYFLLAGPNNW